MGRKIMQADVKPQLLRGRVVETGANTYTEAEIITPNMTEAGYVMEILRVFLELEEHGTFLDGDEIIVSLHETTRAAMPHINDAGVIYNHGQVISFTTSGILMFMRNFTQDYTDGNGNGILTGRKALLLGIQGTSQAGAMAANINILYRLVKATPAEIVGLIST